MNIRIELSSLASRHVSGVGNYTKLLAEALETHTTVSVHGTYFNFLNRQPHPQLNISRLQQNKLFPLRIYAKMQSYNTAPPFDALLPTVDVTIFPNFATWPSIRSKHTATVIHDLTYLHYPEVMETKNLAHLNRIVKRTIRDADTIITVSESVKQEIINVFHIDADKCLVTPIPPDEKYYYPQGYDVRAKYGIPTTKYIYFVGNLEPRKDIPTLVRAYELLPTEIKKEYSLVIGGGRGWKTKASDKAIQEAQQKGENIIHAGYIEAKDAADMYHNASLFVMTSLYEGFGMPLLEAMAARCPVVCSDIPVLHETAGNAARYARVGDASEFAKQILTVLKSSDIHKQMCTSGKKQLQKYSWARNADVLVRHFKETID